MCCACVLIAICVGGGGVAVVVSMVHLHSFCALRCKFRVNLVELVFGRVVVCGWLWLMCCVCLMIAICVDGGGVAVVVRMVHLHSFCALN